MIKLRSVFFVFKFGKLSSVLIAGGEITLFLGHRELCRKDKRALLVVGDRLKTIFKKMIVQQL